MKPPPEKHDSHLMRRMFSFIAPRYDFVTRTLSFGMDRRWKREAVAQAALPQNAVVLDLACGTGDFSQLIMQSSPDSTAIGVDLTEGMLHLARSRGLRDVLCGDVARLPFSDASFDCVFIGYGLRNFPQLQCALAEICRVTRPGGKIVSLDFFLPKNAAFRELYLAWLFAQGALWGLILHGRPRTYTYIPHSLRNFTSIDGLSSLLGHTGYEKVQARSYIFGGIGVHCATKRS